MSDARPRSLVRTAGWLLTPVVAWAASFLGGWVGLLLLPGTESALPGVAGMIGGALVGGGLGIGTWLILLRRIGRPAVGREGSGGGHR